MRIPELIRKLQALPERQKQCHVFFYYEDKDHDTFFEEVDIVEARDVVTGAPPKLRKSTRIVLVGLKDGWVSPTSESDAL